MSELIRKSHNVFVLLYHYVCSAKYRRLEIDKKVDEIIKQTCLEILKRYEIKFIEIGTDRYHVHYLIQSMIPRYSLTKIIQIVKSITARELFCQAPEIHKQLWGGFIETECVFNFHIHNAVNILLGSAQSNQRFASKKA